MDQCSNGTTSHQSSRPLTNQERHALGVDLEGRPTTVLDPWRCGPDPFYQNRPARDPLARLESGQATAEDLTWQQRMTAEIIDLGSSPETPAVLEREDRDMQEGKARAEAGRQRSAERRRAVAEQERLAEATERRLQRRRAGRATEADLAEDRRLAYELRDRSKEGDL